MENKYIYKDSIEKVAINLNSVKDKVVQIATKNKKKLIGAGIGAGTLGAAYTVAPKDVKEKMKYGAKKIVSSAATGQANGMAQDAIKYIGAGLGTAYGLKKGKPLSKAVSKNGLAGMAIGDIAGSVAVPMTELKHEYNKKFGENPNAKAIAATFAANTIPTAALWGGIYGLKNGKIRKNIGNKLSEGISDIGYNFKRGVQSKAVAESIKHKAFKNSDVYKKIFNDAVKDGVRNGKINEKAFQINKAKAFKKFKIPSDAKQKIDKFEQRYKNNLKNTGKGMFGIGGALAGLGAADYVAALPTYVVTPQNVADLDQRKRKKVGK